MVCLETTFLIDLLRGKKEAEHLKKMFDAKEQAQSVAAPTVMEIWSGALLDNAPLDECTLINELLGSLRILPLTEESAKLAAEMEIELIQKGKQVQPVDLMIAAIARINGEGLVTRDEHFARIEGLRVFKY